MSVDKALSFPELDDFLEVLRVGDRDTALGLARAQVSAGRPPADLLVGLVGAAQERIGELWARDEWSVGQEHAATAVSDAVVTMLGTQLPRPPADAPRVVVTCVEHEWHALPARIVAETLRGSGYAVSYLGASTSPAHLTQHVLDLAPRAVAMSCSLAGSLPRVRRQVEAVRQTGTPVMVGGRAFDTTGQRARLLGANGFARTADEAAEVLDGLPTSVTAAPALTHEGATEAFIVHAGRERIAADVHARLLADGIDEDAGWVSTLVDQLPHVVGALAGALVADERAVVDDSLEWAQLVLANRGAEPDIAARLRRQLAVSVRDLPAASRLLA